MKFFAAIRSADFAAKLSTAAGFDFAAAFAAGDENALKSHIAAQVAAGVSAATKPDAALAEQVATLNASLESAVKENETLTAALSGVGFTIPEDTTTTSAALNTFIKVRAQGVLAQSGHAAITTATSGVIAKTMARAAFSALSPQEQMEFATSGGVLTE